MMDKVPNITKLPALITHKRALEAEYLAFCDIPHERAFEIAGELGELQERIDFHSQTGMYASKEPVTHCSLK